MDFLLAIVLGWVQGVTEFLPISSTGHLILVREVFHTHRALNDLAFDAVLHLATTAAVVLYFWKDIVMLVHATFRWLGRLPVDERDTTLIKALAVGTVPAVIFGLLLESTMETLFRQPLLVACVLIAGSLFFAYAEYVHAYKSVATPLSTKTGFKIGLFQVLALVPGMSRSGVTISGGLLLGLSRVEAARFAFLLAIPVMLGGGLKKLLELLKSDASVDWLFIGVGAATAFFVGLATISFMMKFVRRYSLWPFIWYRILLAIFVIALVFFG